MGQNQSAVQGNGRKLLVSTCYGILAGAIGGTLGALIYNYAASYGLDMQVLPGAAIGLPAGIAASRNTPGRKHLVLASICAVSAFCLSVYLEWANFPFVADDSLGYFVAHLLDLSPMRLVLLALSAGLGFWFGMGR